MNFPLPAPQIWGWSYFSERIYRHLPPRKHRSLPRSPLQHIHHPRQWRCVQERLNPNVHRLSRHRPLHLLPNIYGLLTSYLIKRVNGFIESDNENANSLPMGGVTRVRLSRYIAEYRWKYNPRANPERWKFRKSSSYWKKLGKGMGSYPYKLSVDNFWYFIVKCFEIS